MAAMAVAQQQCEREGELGEENGGEASAGEWRKALEASARVEHEAPKVGRRVGHGDHVSDTRPSLMHKRKQLVGDEMVNAGRHFGPAMGRFRHWAQNKV
jgi:hypothetical protein